MRALVPALLLVLATCGAASYFASRPQSYIVPDRPGMIFPVTLAIAGTTSATVFFRTSRPPL